jgi:molecular chaperone Hsp33
MIGNGYMVITISPTEGERYQGVVDLEGETLAECLENYFLRSEQLPTRIFIRTGESEGKAAAGGLLLQVLPAQETDPEEFSHLSQLTTTIKAEELFTLPATEVLYRLYHQEEVTVYEPQDVCFRCTCSRERCADALMTLPGEEVLEMLEEDGKIEMHCDYCGSDYAFDAMDLATYKASGNLPDDSAVH